MLRLVALLGMSAVILGALGAHGKTHDLLLQNQTLEIWKTASLYHLMHAVVLLVLALHSPQSAWPSRCFVTGIVLFSGSLYLLALKSIPGLVYLTPLGGLTLMAGWFLLMLKPKH